MSEGRKTRRAEAEIDAAAAQTGCPGIGNRTIHQFWHLFAPHFRGVLLPPRRRADNGRVAWTWRESGQRQPLTGAELAEVRRRLTQASRSFTGAIEADDREAESLEAQVCTRVAQMSAALTAKSDQALAGFVCRDEAGLLLHSWGAATPAEPVYADSQQGEISGRVILAGNEAAEVSVTLQNSSGLGVARTRSDRSGVFRFQGIAPGNYRLCVVNRTDFAPEGLALTVGKTPLTGLELRSVATPAVPPAPAVAAMPERRQRRGLIGVVVVAGLLVAAGTAWFYRTTRASAPTVTPTDTGWRAAEGELQASSGQPASTELRRAGTPTSRMEGGSKVFAPTTRTPAFEAGAHPATTGRAPAAKELNSTPTGAKPAGGSPHQSSAPDRLPGTEKAATTAADAAGATKAPVTAERVSSGPEPTAAPVSVAVVTPPSERERTAATRGTETVPTSPAAGRLSEPLQDRDENEPQAKGATLRASSEPADDPAGSATQDKRDNPLGPSESPGSVAAGMGASAATTPDSTVTPLTGKSRTESNRLADLVGKGHQEHSDATDGEGAAVDSAIGALTPRPASSTGTSVAKAIAATPGPTAAAAAMTRRPVSGAVEILPEQAGPENGFAHPATPATAPSPPALVVVGRIHAGPWKARLMRDEILATFPQAEGSVEKLGDLREKSLAGRRAALPPAFRAAITWSGIVVEFSAADTIAGHAPHWRGSEDRAPSTTNLPGNRAELTWDAAGPQPGRDQVLVREDGAELLHISVDPAGTILVRAVPGVRCSYWLAVAHTPTDHFQWRDQFGGELPAAWPRDHQWKEGAAARIEVPLPAARNPASDGVIMLCDDSSGWALACPLSRL